MKYILMAFTIFLSSNAEARYGAYNYNHNTSVFGCNNCRSLGVSLRTYLPRSPFSLYHPAYRFEDVIWPPLPAKELP